ncbi:MAG: PBS lyase [Proteobacteria bacterium ST_bin11]|nr:MAG: PBS lyase [Proteobacteria bacterium ST_bin11]
MAFIKKQIDVSVSEDERVQQRDCRSLEAQLYSTDPMARRWAARDLADCEQASTTLVARLSQEADISVREVILSSLAFLGDEVAVAGLVECLRNEDAQLRNEAIEVMKQLPQQVGPIMRGLLTDDNPDLRIFAVNILESLCHPDVETWLLEVINDDQNVNVCATAVDLLVEVGSKDAEQPLRHLKERFAEEPYIQFAADLALKRIAQD